MNPIAQSKILEITEELVGKPYAYGAKAEDAPNVFDCSSFAQYVFKQIGIELPRSSILQAGDKKGKEVFFSIDLKNLETGDLLFMRSDRGFYYDDFFNGRKLYIGHVAIYIGSGKIAHARKKNNGVAIQDLAEVIKEPDYEIILVKRF